MTDINYAGLIATAEALHDDEDAWTWVDNDPSVAWGDQESYHGKLAALYLEAGWEGCYHRSGARFHYSVKVTGYGAWKGFNDFMQAIEDARDERAFGRMRAEEIGQGIEDLDREVWWNDDLPDFIHYDLGRKGAKVWGCGRSGGYVNCRDLEKDPEAMIRLAEWLHGQREYANSEDAGRELAERALEEYDAERLTELASPRIERVEA